MKKLASVMFAMALTTFVGVPSGNAQCCGDCNYSGVVTIDNLITAVNNSLFECPPGSNNIDLPNSTPDEGNILKEGVRFIHNFGKDNTFVGEDAGNFTMTGEGNTATGISALQSNTRGDANTATGFFALTLNTTGSSNIATGNRTLVLKPRAIPTPLAGSVRWQYNTVGDGNTAIGTQALFSHATGSNNTAVGLEAGGLHETGDDNIYVNNVGVAVESNTIRIGTEDEQFNTFIAGIVGATSAGGVPVLVNGEGQLGTITSARRFKREVQDIGESSAGLMRLRPVTFQYRSEYDDGTGL